MSEQSPESSVLLEQFTGHLSTRRYCARIIKRYSAVAGHFLRFLEREQINFSTVQPQDIAAHLTHELKRFHQLHARAPLSQRTWRNSHTAGIHEFMRMLNGRWPPMPVASTPVERYIQQFCTQFTQWLADERALAAVTIDNLADEAKRFLSWYLGRAKTVCLLGLQVTDIDAYLQERSISLRRPSRKGVSQRLRCFMRFAHITGNTVRDFAPSVMSPTLYAFEARR